MKTIYLLQKAGRYAVAPKILRAFEIREDAEDLIALMKKADVEELEIAELVLQEAPKPPPHIPAPMAPPRNQWGSLPPVLSGQAAAAKPEDVGA